MANEALLSMKKINMTFPGVKALQNVDFTLRSGEIHALMGENGAGKSTLIKVLTGVHTRESGEIYLDGKMINNRSPEEAQMNGISTVFQEVNLCTNISVAENIFAGHEPRKDEIEDHRGNKGDDKPENLLFEVFPHAFSHRSCLPSD